MEWLHLATGAVSPSPGPVESTADLYAIPSKDVKHGDLERDKVFPDCDLQFDWKNIKSEETADYHQRPGAADLGKTSPPVREYQY